MKQGKSDYILLGTVCLLTTLGILILSSVSAILSQKMFGNTFYFLLHQIFFGLIPGVILAFIFFKIKLDFLKRAVPLLLLINLVFVAMVFLPKIGTEFRGSSRWVNLGPISFQPTEFLKLTFILYLAAWLAGLTEKVSHHKGKKIFSETFVAFLIVVGLISLLLIFQPDISTLGVMVLVAIIMYFSVNTPVWHSIFIILSSAVGLLVLIKTAPYRLNRLLVFLNPDLDPMGKGYQIKQALIAIGSGGISGLGLGMSRQKFDFLPHSVSDAIFAIFAEEAGFIGSSILVFLFLVFLWRGFKIAKASHDQFSQLAALGITSWIAIQAFINIGSLIRIMPLAGIPLPFISYGGSALVAELIGVGILLNISKSG